jgi:sugar phosphate isomerase/epimerase
MWFRQHAIGVCSWSLRPAGSADLVAKLGSLGVEHVHLSVAPLLALDGTQRESELRLLRDSGITITAAQIGFPGEDYSTLLSIRRTGGLVANTTWSQRKEMALRAGRLAAQMGVTGLSLHAGFIPQSNDPGYGALLGRICEIAEPLAQFGIRLLLETGQETASELLQFLNDLRCQNVGCNFDTANLVLYGAGDPLDSVSILSRHIQHVHLKDATPSDQPGVKWGSETPLGEGVVPILRIIDALDEVQYRGPLLVEVGDDTSLDKMRASLAYLTRL